MISECVISVFLFEFAIVYITSFIYYFNNIILEITCQVFLSKKYKKISDFSEIFILLVDFFSTPTV